MPTNETTIQLKIGRLTEEASKLILAICAKLGCTPEEAVAIIANKLTGKEAA